jgi:hypothetical protein
VLVEKMTAKLPFGTAMAIVTLFSEGILLVVAAQAGFLDGPRVLANMAVDHWVPRRFAALSDRLTTQNGIVLMGAASLGALVYTNGDVGKIVVMYSINVFLTFSLSLFAMTRKTFAERRTTPGWMRKLSVFMLGFALCAVILVITVFEKFGEGGWLTLVVTALVVLLCFVIRRHYRSVRARLEALYHDVRDLDDGTQAAIPITHRNAPTACVLVATYDGVGIHTVLNVFRSFPNHFKNLVFISVGVIDSGGFKGADSVEALEEKTVTTLKRFCSLATSLDGMPSTYKYGIGTDAVAEAEKVCRQVMAEFPVVTFIGGKVIFEHEAWYQRFLHNETALAIQKRLYWMGATMVVLPAKVT